MAKSLKNRPALILSSEPSSWMSCRIITPNLERAYRAAFHGEANCFSYTESLKPTEIWKLSGEIYLSKPDRLVFIDHIPHPEALLVALANRYGNKPLPPIFVHVYGDFTLYASHWLKVQEILKKTRVHFTCASDRQVSLISRFLYPQAGQLGRCHFPVDKQMFHFDSGLREQWRTKLGMGVDDRAVIYTGRVSLQKNLTRVLREVSSLSATSSLSHHLVIAGNFDDLGAPFFGLKQSRGFYFQYWNELMNKLSSEQRKRVHYLGQLECEELRGLYNAGDVFFSLSLHHDEDYGMSPAESLCCGTPVVLSDWGGYASFVDQESVGPVPDCQLIPVQIGRYGLRISEKSCQKSLLARVFVNGDSELSERQARSERYQKRFSIEAATEIIEKIHSELPPRFLGFSSALQKYAECFAQPVPFPTGPVRGTFYEEIYSAYTQPAL